MPTPQPPLILVDNVFDRINLYPLATLFAGSSVVGREVQYIADYRRERSFFQAGAATAGQAVWVDLGAGNTAQPDMVWIDRGHNLWGQSISIVGSDDNFGTSPVNITPATVPAIGTVGGDPTLGWCVTEEGALYTFIAPATARRYWRVLFNSVPAAAVILTGVILGKRTQLLEYSSVRDEDAGGRTERSQESDAGYLAVDRVYSYRTCTIALDLIGATEYDSTMRTLRAQLFERNQPCLIVMNYGDKPERGWLMQYQGKAWSAPMTRVHRKWTGTFREVGALIR